jgi:hypothetical protein
LLFQATLPTYSSRIAVSAVDNLIMVHQIDAKVVILYDVFMDSYTPISAPLPLLVRGLPSNSRQAAQTADHQSSAYGGTLYGEGWNFLIPDLICDADNGLLWKLHLDLEVRNQQWIIYGLYHPQRKYIFVLTCIP